MLLALLMSGPPLLSPPAAAQEAVVNAPDFSAVTSKSAAKRLVREGRLVEITLFPAELGGPDDPQNIGYITPEAADARERVIDTLTRYLEDDAIDQMSVSPDYKGHSIVPSRITLSARHSEREGSIELAIEVW